jgi:hypothetical protein
MALTTLTSLSAQAVVSDVSESPDTFLEILASAERRRKIEVIPMEEVIEQAPHRRWLDALKRSRQATAANKPAGADPAKRASSRTDNTVTSSIFISAADYCAHSVTCRHEYALLRTADGRRRCVECDAIEAKGQAHG